MSKDVLVNTKAKSSWKGYPELISVSGSKGTARIDGIPYHYCDRSGKITVGNIYRLFIMIGFRVLHTGEFDMFKVIKSTTVFIIATDVRIHKECHQIINASKQSALKLELEIVNCGRTSVVLKKTIMDERTSALLAKCLMKCVIFDVKVGKAAILPEWFVTKYKGSKAQVGNINDVTIPVIPEQTYKIEFTIRSSDLDEYNHTGTPNYVTYCVDCAVMATNDEYYDGIKGDFATYVIEHVLTLHRGQSYLGENILIKTWQEKDLKTKLHFVISKEREIICYLSMLINEQKQSHL